MTRTDLALAAGLGLLLALLAAAHPGLVFVDFLSFANRARRLSEGQELVSGLYPIGYPALLLGARALLGDVLVAGKVLSALAGIGAALAAARLAGPGAALAMAAVPGFLLWGSTEGTDLGAAALGLGALAAARERPALAGVLLGASCLVRYTGIAALPGVLILAPRRGRALLAFILATAPHWGVALWLGVSPLPDQSQNIAIGGGGPPGAIGETLRRLPVGAGRAAWTAWGTLWGGLGIAGLLWGIYRKDRVCTALLSWGLLHVVGVGLAFSNPRLVLPATLVTGLGLGGLLPVERRRWLALPALLAMSLQLPALLRPGDGEQALREIAAFPLPPPTLSSSPLYHQRRDGWLMGAANLRSLGGDPRRLDPERLIREARARGVRSLALDAERVGASFPGLAPLLRGPAPDGLELAFEAEGWRLYELR